MIADYPHRGLPCVQYISSNRRAEMILDAQRTKPRFFVLLFFQLLWGICDTSFAANLDTA
jgi:hypothetical protein